MSAREQGYVCTSTNTALTIWEAYLSRHASFCLSVSVCVYVWDALALTGVVGALRTLLRAVREGICGPRAWWMRTAHCCSPVCVVHFCVSSVSYRAHKHGQEVATTKQLPQIKQRCEVTHTHRQREREMRAPTHSRSYAHLVCLCLVLCMCVDVGDDGFGDVRRGDVSA